MGVGRDRDVVQAPQPTEMLAPGAGSGSTGSKSTQGGGSRERGDGMRGGRVAAAQGRASLVVVVPRLRVLGPFVLAGGAATGQAAGPD